MNKSFLLAVVCGLLVAPTGCASMWKEVPLEKKPPTDVRFDASWYSENASPDVIERLKKHRQEQVDRTVSQRAAGKVGISLSELVGGGAVAVRATPSKLRAKQSQPRSISMPSDSAKESHSETTVQQTSTNRIVL
ncbi:MAG: hypothetical protein AAFU85_31950 [Planctomycetota bacterium]